MAKKKVTQFEYTITGRSDNYNHIIINKLPEGEFSVENFKTGDDTVSWIRFYDKLSTFPVGKAVDKNFEKKYNAFCREIVKKVPYKTVYKG